MGSSLNRGADPGAVRVADASTVINLNATGCAKRIIAALPHPLAVVDIVRAELEAGRSRGRPDAGMLDDLLSAGFVNLVSLDEAAMTHFETLVVGSAAETLDDGESATIAFAAASDAVAVIDERKALRIASHRFPDLRVGCTIDLLKQPAIEDALGVATLTDAIFRALCDGRMRVLPRHIEWVVGMIGTERAELCSSLPGSVRNRTRRTAIEG